MAQFAELLFGGAQPVGQVQAGEHGGAGDWNRIADIA
jgi:hypothetical protein